MQLDNKTASATEGTGGTLAELENSKCPSGTRKHYRPCTWDGNASATEGTGGTLAELE